MIENLRPVATIEEKTMKTVKTCLVVEPYPSEKKNESIGMMTFPIYGKIK